MFFDDEDRCRFYLLLQEGTQRFGYRVHGFCLMDNHVHLALQVGEIPLAKSMQNLSFRFTRWINRRQGRVGHLFEGRYKALLVDRDSYLVLRQVTIDGIRATQMIQVKAQSAENGLRPFQGLQRRIGSSGWLPLGEPGSGRPRCCASWQGGRPFPARRALRPTASRLAESINS